MLKMERFNEKEKRRILAYILKNWDEYAAIESDIADVVASKLDLDAAMERLNDCEYDIIYARYMRGYTMQETADQIGKSLGYVCKVEHGAMDKIIKYMFAT